jgi:hypothetical protein
MRESLDVGIFTESSGQLLGDDVLRERNLASLHLFSNVRQVLIEIHDDIFSLFSREDLIEYVVSDRLRERAPVSADHIKTFHLADNLLISRACSLNLECSILLFLEKQK